MMWCALHIIHSGLARSGGLTLHATLVSLGGMGSLIAGEDCAEKSTCCRRIAETWNVSADDGMRLVVDNSCRMGKTVPVFLLRVSPSREFRKRMKGTFPRTQKSRVTAHENIDIKFKCSD